MNATKKMAAPSSPPATRRRRRRGRCRWSFAAAALVALAMTMPALHQGPLPPDAESPATSAGSGTARAAINKSGLVALAFVPPLPLAAAPSGPSSWQRLKRGNGNDNNNNAPFIGTTTTTTPSSKTALHGIPKMFRWLTDQYPDILNRQLISQGLSADVDVDNFYLDMNGIIHPATHGNNDENIVVLDETAMFKKIFLYVDR